MDQGISSALTGLADGLSGYMQIGTQLGIRRQLAQEDLQQKKDYFLWEKSVEAAMQKPVSTIEYGKLKKLNPKLEAMGLSDDTKIPTSDLSDFASLLPKDEGSGTNPYLSLPEMASHLYLLGVPDDKIGDITSRFHQNGSKGVLKSVLDDAAKAYGARPADTETRLRIFANSAGVDPTSDEFMPSFRKWSDSIDSYKKEKTGSQVPLPHRADEQAASMASDLFQTNVKKGMSQRDSLDTVTKQLAEAYDPETVNRILNRVDHTLTPRPKSPHPGFKSILTRLLGQEK